MLRKAGQPAVESGEVTLEVWTGDSGVQGDAQVRRKSCEKGLCQVAASAGPCREPTWAPAPCVHMVVLSASGPCQESLSESASGPALGTHVRAEALSFERSELHGLCIAPRVTHHTFWSL